MKRIPRSRKPVPEWIQVISEAGKLLVLFLLWLVLYFLMYAYTGA